MTEPQMTFDQVEPARRFDGNTYEPAQDCPRLTGALALVAFVMSDGRWRTLCDIANECRLAGRHVSEASISARLRDLRKERFGSHTVDRRRAADARGLFEYRLTLNEKDA